MRILMCNNFFYLRGGTERCFFDLSDLLTSQGHEVIPFSMEHEKNIFSEYSQYFVSNIDYPSLMNTDNTAGKYFKTTRRALYSSEAKQKIRQLIEATRPDIAHIHGIDHQLSPSILDEIKRFGIPIVQTLHDYKLLCPNTTFTSGHEVCERCKGGNYYQVVIRRCKRQSFSASFLAGMAMYFHKLLQIFEKNVDVFISPSKFLMNKFNEHDLNIPIVYLPNFINIERFSPSYQPSDYFLYYGRLNRIKGLSTLIEAMKYVKTPRLYVAGDGDMKEDLERLINQEKEINITLLGHLDTDELIPLIQDAMFTVIPSQNLENCPMAILESYACGTPVLGSNLGGISELIQDGHNGYLFEPGNVGQLVERINSFTSDSKNNIPMGRNGRNYVREFHNPNEYYKQINSIYNDLVDRYRVGITADEGSTVGNN